eukprot:TRINITY_DN3564_c0_g1_i1.p3 TRINITY_DN3564_c0_g1~~TRINITY_DN3564_c0_g1_i1.p3  ORF type:complete len:67 (+),score=28.64 TRINITY_DN3564_c0_g1_i1:226-426(+)
MAHQVHQNNRQFLTRLLDGCGKKSNELTSGERFESSDIKAQLENIKKKKKYRLRGRSSETAKAHRG